MTRVLVVDNYDSFVYTLNGYLLELGAETTVLRKLRHLCRETPEGVANRRRPSGLVPTLPFGPCWAIRDGNN